MNEWQATGARAIATCGGIGKLRGAPGTVASITTAVLALLTPDWSWGAFLGLCVAASMIGTWAAQRMETLLGTHDHSSIVIDEVAGTLCALICVDRAVLWQVALATLLFRLLDIYKPWPICLIDRRVQGGLGVMLDDIGAGLLVTIVFVFVR